MYRAEVFIITDTDNYDLVTIYVAAKNFANAELAIYQSNYNGQPIFAIHSITKEGWYDSRSDWNINNRTNSNRRT